MDSVPRPEEENENWEEEEEGELEYDDGYDSVLDAEAEAEAIARRLNEQLWADIAKAQADRAAAISTSTEAPASSSTALAVSNSPGHVSSGSRKEHAAISTMKSILEYAQRDPLFHSTLATATISDLDNGDALSILSRAVAEGSISKGIARPLSRFVISLARSETLFSTLRNSNASAIELQKGKYKRKREAEDEMNGSAHYRVTKRALYSADCEHLRSQVQDAVHAVSQALTDSAAKSSQSLDSSVIASIRLQLHQVFLFSVTSSSGQEGRDASMLQEIGGLIQVLGVLSGIQIGQSPGANSAFHPDSLPQPSTSTLQTPISDIGTAVYRCLVPSCNKTFIRLYSLRAHQRAHIHSNPAYQGQAGDRPFRCTSCPAMFARNHDLKRHMKLHDSRAFKCTGCSKVFSRRDAIKRHKNAAMQKVDEKARKCVDAEVEDVDVDGVEEGRKIRTWTGGGAARVPGYVLDHEYAADPFAVEEGEMDLEAVSSLQAAVLRLHFLLQEHVTKALGAAPEGPVSTPHGSAYGGNAAPSGQITLASVMARAQPQNIHPSELLTDGPGTAGMPEISGDVGNTSLSSAPDQAEQQHSSSLSLYGLSEEQTRLLEQAIATAATAAQAQAEAEAAMEEEDDELGSGGSEIDELEGAEL